MGITQGQGYFMFFPVKNLNYIFSTSCDVHDVGDNMTQGGEVHLVPSNHMTLVYIQPVM